MKIDKLNKSFPTWAMFFYIFLIWIIATKTVYGEQGASLAITGTLTDINTGIEFDISFSAEENFGEGVGQTTLALFSESTVGNAVRACSLQGGSIVADENPFANMLCHRNGRMAVSIEKCKATIEMHGFVHSDYPYVTYSGSTTIDIDVTKNPYNSLVKLTIYTPKRNIMLIGELAGEVLMSTCQ